MLVGLGHWSLEVLGGALTPEFALQTLAAVLAAVIVAWAIESRLGRAPSVAGLKRVHVEIHTEQLVLSIDGLAQVMAGGSDRSTRVDVYGLASDPAPIASVEGTGEQPLPLIARPIRRKPLVIMPRDAARRKLPP